MNPSLYQETSDTLCAMRRQEESYSTYDVITDQQQEAGHRATSVAQHIDVDCRDKMSEWCVSVVKFCKFSTESVEIAMNYLDRFLATPAGIAALHDRSTYQLASMTTLYTAIKVHERQAMNPAVVAQLSRNTYSEEQVVAMEAVILAALQWRMNPPTVLSFCREILNLLPQSVLGGHARETVLEICQLQAELATQNYDFIGFNSSTIAFCAFQNAIESLGCLGPKAACYASFAAARAIGLEQASDDVLRIKRGLHAAVHAFGDAGEGTRQSVSEAPKQHVSPRASFEESPRAVSDRDIEI